MDGGYELISWITIVMDKAHGMCLWYDHMHEYRFLEVVGHKCIILCVVLK